MVVGKVSNSKIEKYKTIVRKATKIVMEKRKYTTVARKAGKSNN